MKREPVEPDVGERLHAALASLADVLARGESGWALLDDAIHKGDSKLVRALLSAGADPSVAAQEAEDSAGTPLHWAAESGSPDAVQALIAAGADPNSRTPFGDTPLHSWARSDFVWAETDAEERQSAVGALLDSGANAVARNAAGATPWDVLQESPWRLHLVEGSDDYRRLGDARLSAEGEAGWTPLHAAVAEGDLEALKALLAAGADPNAEALDDGIPLGTSLHLAAENGNLEFVRVLLAAGADLDARDGDGATPLHLAAAHGHPELVQALLAAGAAPRALDGDLQTPLHEAATNGSPESVQALLAAGADPNAKAQDSNAPDDFDETPLHLAAGYGHLASARALLVAGADPNAKSGTGHAPLHYAAEGNVELIGALLAAGADPNHAANEGRLQHFLPETAQDDLAQRCKLAFNADCSSAGFGWTPLHVAARYGSADSVQALVAAGADVKARAGKEGETPLHVAVVFGSSELACSRSHSGDDREGKGESVAVPRGHARYVESAKVLLDAGADPSARTESGVTPLNLAVDGDFFGD